MRNIAKKVIHDHPKSFISMVLLIILSIITYHRFAFAAPGSGADRQPLD
ncbi:hypothetical protein [Lactobacillus delbrueckii]|nr:hypothetical protein [Lactobacillus delbrueckii]UYX13704.1 hypothetical protein OJ966_05005 [Lactobacillus delbrueckii]